jgi:hypothetical protein
MLEKFSNFMKILPVEAEFFHAEGQKYRRTDGQRVRQTHTTKPSFSMRKDRSTEERTDRG